MKNNLLFIDIRKNIKPSKFFKTLSSLEIDNYDIVVLTPYSIYLCELYDFKYKGFHSFISVEKFKDNILFKIKKFEKLLNKFYNGLMIDIIPAVSFSEYEFELLNIYNSYSQDKVLITNNNVNEYDYTNNSSFLNLLDFKKVFYLEEEKIILKESRFNGYRNLSLGLSLKKSFNKILKLNINYDWLNYLFFIVFNKKNKIQYIFDKYKFIENTLIEKMINENINSRFLKNMLLNKLTNFYIQKNKNNEIAYKTWITNNDDFVNSYNQNSIFYQHGNYFYKNMIFKYSEIAPADVNFVFNDYTKKVFENLGSKKVFSVGSILFNKPIKERKKEYDFLYITQGHDYIGNLQYVDFPNSLHSFDGYELYQRHKSIIQLFGTKFKDKKIIIRVHPAVVTTGVYVPFWELAEPYPNITIDVSIPIHTLIEKSEYIISDYFTTEFINRDLHYKRDIILFQGAPTPLPEETIEDMKKMFILVDTVEDLESKVNNIENITKDRQRYDDIIEYYSSKKCDTKKVVTEILEKELNARN